MRNLLHSHSETQSLVLGHHPSLGPQSSDNRGSEARLYRNILTGHGWKSMAPRLIPHSWQGLSYMATVSVRKVRKHAICVVRGKSGKELCPLSSLHSLGGPLGGISTEPHTSAIQFFMKRLFLNLNAILAFPHLHLMERNGQGHSRCWKHCLLKTTCQEVNKMSPSVPHSPNT